MFAGTPVARSIGGGFSGDGLFALDDSLIIWRGRPMAGRARHDIPILQEFRQSLAWVDS